jgi:hypothetical protein
VSVLKKYQTIILAFFVSGFVLIYLSLYVHETFLILLLMNIVFCSWRAKSVRCARCGCPVAPDVGSSALEIFRSFRQRKCRECNASLD